MSSDAMRGLKMHLIDFSLTGPAVEVWASTPVDQDPDGFLYYDEVVVQVGCYVCSGFNVETAPLVRVIGTKIVDQRDPTEVLKLACGHVRM